MFPQLKSISGYDCLTECHKPYVNYAHPIIGAYSHTSYPNCAVNTDFIRTIGSDNHNPMEKFIDGCSIEDNKDHIIDEAKNLKMMTSYNFNARNFLRGLYNIKTFDECIIWTRESHNLPYYTIQRVHNCCWRTFGRAGVSDMVVNYYYDFAMENWLPGVASTIAAKYEFNVSEESANNVNVRELLNDIFTKKYFFKLVAAYISTPLAEWDNFGDHYYDLRHFVEKRLTKKLTDF